MLTDVVEKLCPGCGETKPASDFHKDSAKADGLNCSCKLCRAQGYQYLAPGVAREIAEFDQVESVVRAMAELRGAIDIAQAHCEAEVHKLRDWSRQDVDPWAARLVNWERLIREFFLKHILKGAAERKYTFRFGCVEVCGKRVTVTLNAKLAAASAGKP